MIGAGEVDPLGFVAEELVARGALIERKGERALAVVPGGVAGQLDLAEAVVLAADPSGDEIGCGLGSPLLDRLMADVRASVPVASVAWHADPPRLATVERLVERWSWRNAVADALEVAHAPATYLAGVFSWTAEADDRYDGVTMVVAHGASASAPDDEATAALARVIAGEDGRVTEEGGASGIAAARPARSGAAPRTRSVRASARSAPRSLAGAIESAIASTSTFAR